MKTKTILPNNWPKGGWEETARQCQRNYEWYRGLLEQIGEMLGEEVFICDDGSKSQDMLISKIPEIVKKRLGKT